MALWCALLGWAAAGADSSRGLRVVPRVPGAQEMELYTGSHALVIGVSKYSNGWPSLPGVADDLRAVASLLRGQGFEVTEVPDPTRQALDAALREFVATWGMAEGNRLLVYFAGHGDTRRTPDGRDLGYVVPSDAPLPGRDPAAFKRVAMSMNEIESFALQIESKHALFVFDCCFSGSLFESTRGVPPSITAKTAQPVRQFITAGTGEQEVPDRSVFCEQFVEGVRGEADADKDGYVTGSELGVFLESRVSNYSNASQTPRYGKIRNPKLDKGDFVFAAGAPPQPPQPPVKPPAGGQGVDFAQLQRQAEARKAWEGYQARMAADYGKAQSYEAQPGAGPDLKAKAWEMFLEAYREDNQLSLEDEAMRSRAKDRATYWRGEEGVVQKRQTVGPIEPAGPAEAGRDGPFVAYSNGTVLDTRTTLEWKAGPDQDTTYDQAVAWVRGLGGGWRMPTREELRRLYEKGKGSRNMSPLFRTTGWWVWAESRDASSAWYFIFCRGDDYWHARADSRYTRGFAVRARAGG